MNLTKWYFWEYDFECALVDDEGNILLSGDYYHDKIDSKIDGFVLGLEYMSEKPIVSTKYDDGCFDDWKARQK